MPAVISARKRRKKGVEQFTGLPIECMIFNDNSVPIKVKRCNNLIIIYLLATGDNFRESGARSKKREGRRRSNGGTSR